VGRNLALSKLPQGFFELQLFVGELEIQTAS
jgi:hypothetical protein